MNREELISYLEGVDLGCAYPIFIPSVLRPAHYTYTNLVSLLPSCIRKKVFYVVRESEYKLYKRAQPDSQFIVIKNRDITPTFGTDSTRAILAEKAHELGFSKIIDMDDDISYLTMTYSNPETGTSRRLNKALRERYVGNMFALAAKVSNQWFKKDPKAVLGSFLRITPNTCAYDYSETKVASFAMGIPRQFQILHVKRAYSIGALRTGAYDMQAEDIAYCANVLEHGGTLFRLPCFVYDVPDELINKRTEVILHAAEGDEKFLCTETAKLLRKTIIGDHLLVTARFKDGTPRYFTINWRTYNKRHGTSPVIERW